MWLSGPSTAAQAGSFKINDPASSTSSPDPRLKLDFSNLRGAQGEVGDGGGSKEGGGGTAAAAAVVASGKMPYQEPTPRLANNCKQRFAEPSPEQVRRQWLCTPGSVCSSQRAEACARAYAHSPFLVLPLRYYGIASEAGLPVPPPPRVSRRATRLCRPHGAE